MRHTEKILGGDPGTGIAKPDALKYNLSGLWSRRLSEKDRVVYSCDDRHSYIFAIGGHYDRTHSPNSLFRLFVVTSEPDHFYDSLLIVNLENKSVLDIDSSRIGA